MKSKLLGALLNVFIYGCSVNASMKNPEETNYVSVEKYTAGLIQYIFQGGFVGCRVSSHNMILGESEIIMNEKDECTVGVSSVSD